MGITGLIPFLEKASKRGNISQFSGKTVAIDSYCWLHKGAFSCADKIAMGQPTDALVKYCMKFIQMLLANRIKPILVFDGRHLPAKKETESKRRGNRESTRRRAVELMKMGQHAEGRNLLRRCVDITHEMALQLIKECQEKNVDCIVAPYEADAQLAYLNITGIADVVITEDSDLTLFGCKKIFFKMDINGNGLLVEQDRLHLAMNVREEHFDMDKFRHMCILSGCDYLASLPGIGLSKACKFILRNSEDDIHKALTRLGSYLNMKALVVTTEYRDAFMRALITFKHQMVYCPLQRKQVRLYPPPPEVTEEQLRYAGDEISEDVAYQLALGNYDPFTMRELHNYDPDRPKKRKTNSWYEKSSCQHVSIWSKDFKISEEKENERKHSLTKWPNTAGKIITLNTNATKEKTKTTPKKRNFTELAEELSENEVLDLYGNNKLRKNDDSTNGQITPPLHEKSSPTSDDNGIRKSPISRRTNPFAKSPQDSQVSPSLVCRGKRRIKLKNFIGFRPTVIDENNVQTSKYFSSKPPANDDTKNNDETSSIEGTEFSKNPTRGLKLIVENERINDRETNFIEEILSPDDISSSSGIFSGEIISQGNVAINTRAQNCQMTRTERLTSVEEKFHDRNIDNSSDANCNENESDRAEKCSPNSIAGWDNDDGKTIGRNNSENLRSSLFKWANTKDNPKINIAGAPAIKKKPVVKQKTTKKTTCRGESLSVERQQSLLNMFGFQRKSVLKKSLVATSDENDMENSN